jgi:hypothetical protein
MERWALAIAAETAWQKEARSGLPPALADSPVATATSTFVRELEFWAEQYPPRYATLFAERLAVLREWQSTAPFAVPADVPSPAWHGAAKALFDGIVAAFDEAGITPPAKRKLTVVVQELLHILGENVSTETIRGVL